MSRLVMCGWETGDITQIGSTSNGSAATTTVVNSTPTARSGTYCLKCLRNATNSVPNGTARVHVPLGSGQTELFIGFGLYTSNSGAEAAPNEEFLRIFDSAGNVNLAFFCDAGTIRAYYANAGGTASSLAQLTLIATGSGSVSQSAWHLIEIHAIAATGATGTLEVRLDGVSIISVTGQRTAQTNANYADVCPSMAPLAAAVVRTDFFAFDDLRVQNTSGSVNNSWTGDGSIRPLLPNGVGTTIGGTALTPVGTTPNYTNVDEVPPSTADYNSGSTVGTGETYALGDPPAAMLSCAAINVIANANNDVAGGNIGITIRSGGTNNEGAAQAITTTAAYYNRLMEIDPTDSTAWTQTKLTNLEAGITIR